MKPPALGLLPDTRGGSIYFPPRCDLPRDGPHGPRHPGQIFWACSKIFPSTQTEQNLGHFSQIGDIRSPGDEIVAYGMGFRRQLFRLVMSKEETETLALTLLAAANYTEEK